MLATGGTAIEHFRRGDIVDSAANITGGISVQIGEGRKFLASLMVGQRIVHDRVLRDFGQRDVLSHIVQVGAVILPHEEELAGVAKYGGTDARLLESRILLHDGNVPAIELAKLSVTLLHNFLAAGNIEE